MAMVSGAIAHEKEKAFLRSPNPEPSNYAKYIHVG